MAGEEPKVDRMAVLVRRAGKDVRNRLMVEAGDVPDLLKGVLDDLPVGLNLGLPQKLRAANSLKGYPLKPVPNSPRYSLKVSLELGSTLMKTKPSQVSTEIGVRPRVFLSRLKKLSSSAR